MPVTPNNLIWPVFASLFAWRIYRRFRRSVGRQPVQPKRMMVRIAIFGVITLIASAISLLSTKLMIGLGCGLVLGVPLGLLGLHLTRFETTPEGRFYTPNTYIGVAVSILFFARVAYRMMILYTSIQPLTNAPQPDFLQSPPHSFHVRNRRQLLHRLLYRHPVAQLRIGRANQCPHSNLQTIRRQRRRAIDFPAPVGYF